MALGVDRERLGRRAIRANRHVLLDPRFRLSPGPIGQTLATQRHFLMARADTLVARIREGRIVDAHGDLRPEHVWPIRPVTIIDCLEFDARLRALDPLDDVAFLHLECERLGARWAGERLCQRLAARLGDDPSSGLFLFYHSHRACRGRGFLSPICTPRAPDKWLRQARAYLKLATRDAARLDRVLRTP